MITQFVKSMGNINKNLLPGSGFSDYEKIQAGAELCKAQGRLVLVCFGSFGLISLVL